MQIIPHLPVLIVVVPLLAAPLCSLFSSPRLAWLLAIMASAFCLVSAVVLLGVLQQFDTLSYAVGAWPPPLGIELRIDFMSALLLLILSGIGLLVMLYAWHSVASEIAPWRQANFYAAMLLVLAGLIGMTVTGDVFNLFVFLEISSLASYALISMGKDRRALNAAFQYLILGTIGATFILIGVGFMYVMTGTLNMQDLAQRLPAVADTRSIRAAFAFITVGLGLKAAMFPLHLWLPNAYAYSPSVVSAFLAATSTKVAIYALMRFLLSLYGVQFALGLMPFDTILMALGAIGIIAGSVMAVLQTNVKRMLAYSSIAQIGYILLAIGLASQPGMTAALLHMFNHAVIKATLFLALGIVCYRLGGAELQHLAGSGKTMPLTMAAFTIAGLSLIGVPTTAGFVSKWYLVSALLNASLWPLALLVMLGSVLALIYIGKVIETAYFRPASNATNSPEAPLSMLAPVCILAGANIYFGLNTDFSLGLSTLAAGQFQGLAP